jgi:uracil-DNA glycosylase
MEELSIIRPAAIICLGAVGAKSLLGKRLAVNKERGKWFDGPMGIPLILTFHPSYLRRATASGKEERERQFRLDLQEARHVSGMR